MLLVAPLLTGEGVPEDSPPLSRFSTWALYFLWGFFFLSGFRAPSISLGAILFPLRRGWGPVSCHPCLLGVKEVGLGCFPFWHLLFGVWGAIFFLLHRLWGFYFCDPATLRGLPLTFFHVPWLWGTLLVTPGLWLWKVSAAGPPCNTPPRPGPRYSPCRGETHDNTAWQNQRWEEFDFCNAVGSLKGAAYFTHSFP